jgi:hypothetical protein
LIEQRGITESLNVYLQGRTSIWRAENAGIEINHVDLVRRAEEALRQHVALRISTGTESCAMSAKCSAFTGVTNISDHCPTANGTDGIEGSGFKIAVN